MSKTAPRHGKKRHEKEESRTNDLGNGREYLCENTRVSRLNEPGRSEQVRQPPGLLKLRLRKLRLRIGKPKTPEVAFLSKTLPSGQQFPKK